MSLPVNSVQDLISLAEFKPGEINYATGLVGSASFLAAELFKLMAGVDMVRISYKGGGPAMSDLIGGQVQLGFANPASAMALVKAGRLRAIAVTGEKRLETLPQVPTFAEAGLPGLALRNWYAITAPAGTPKAVIDRLSAAILQILTMPDIKAALARQGLDSFAATSEQIDVVRREDMARVGKIIKAANITVQ